MGSAAMNLAWLLSAVTVRRPRIGGSEFSTGAENVIRTGFDRQRSQGIMRVRTASDDIFHHEQEVRRAFVHEGEMNRWVIHRQSHPCEE
jgi:hypothetical protein